MYILDIGLRVKIISLIRSISLMNLFANLPHNDYFKICQTCIKVFSLAKGKIPLIRIPSVCFGNHNLEKNPISTGRIKKEINSNLKMNI